MKSELSSLEIGFIVDELRSLIGAKITKIYLLEDKDAVFLFHKPSLGKIKVRVMAPRGVFLTEQDFEFPEKPLNLCQQLRKYLENSRLKDIRQFNSERILELDFEGNAVYRIIIELFSKGNIILCTENYEIIAVSERQFWSDRKIIPGEVYQPPKEKFNFYDIDSEKLLSLLKLSDKDSIVKSLAMDIGLGGGYAEEVCLLSSIVKTKSPRLISASEASELVNSVNDVLHSEKKPGIAFRDLKAINVVPFRLKSLGEVEFKEFESFSKALDYYYSHEFKKTSSIDKKINEISRIIASQEEMIEGIKADIAESTGKADSIYQNYVVVREVIDELIKARKKFSWKEIKERVKGNQVIKEIDEKQGKVVIDLKV